MGNVSGRDISDMTPVLVGYSCWIFYVIAWFPMTRVRTELLTKEVKRSFRFPAFGEMTKRR
jgi:hypothetical protein